MIIGIDASRSQDHLERTGVEKISDALVFGLAKTLSGEHDVWWYTPTKISGLPQGRQVVLPFRRFWTLIRLSFEMLTHKPDVFFSPVHELPFFCPKKTFRLVHDVAFLKHPTSYPLLERLYLRFGLWRTLRICKKIFVPTEAVRQDLLTYTKANPKKIAVIGFGFDRENPENKNFMNEKTFVYIGRIEHKKNIMNIIKGFEMFAANNNEYRLLLAGKPGHGYEEIAAAVKKSAAHIELLGYIGDEHRQKLQRSATAVILASFEEGFGIPVLEGLDWGSVVIASDIAPLREICQDACVYVQPDSPQAIAYALGVATDPEVQKRYPKKGFQQITQFDWQKVITEIIKNLTTA